MMVYEDSEKIKDLFNSGKLRLQDAVFYGRRGFEIIISAGLVRKVIEPICEDVSAEAI